jgi:hypothetical protein
MGIRYEVWQGEGNVQAWLWVMDIIRVNIQEYHGEAPFWVSTVRGSGL